MKTNWLATGAMFFGTALSVFAADVTGTWSGQMAGPNGDGFALSFALKQDGSKLTGTVKGPQGDPIEISEGKVDGDKLSFTINVNGGQMVIHHEGVIKGDSIELTSKSDQFPEGKMTLKKDK